MGMEECGRERRRDAGRSSGDADDPFIEFERKTIEVDGVD